LPKCKFPEGSEVRNEKSEIMAERVFKLAIYLFTTVVTLKAMLEGGYLHKYLLGD
jgi:hypothetical protein